MGIYVSKRVAPGVRVGVRGPAAVGVLATGGLLAGLFGLCALMWRGTFWAGLWLVKLVVLVYAVLFIGMWRLGRLGVTEGVRWYRRRQGSEPV